MHTPRVGMEVLLLLQAVATFAAPNIIPSRPQPAAAPAMATIATAANPAITANPIIEAEFQPDLKPREALGGPQTSLTIANSFTHTSASLNASLTLPGTAMLSSPASASAGPMGIGSFTGADGGVYDVTSQSGYVVIDGKTLAPGQNALIGNGVVSDGAGGLVANGQTVVLSSVTVAATTTEAMTTGATMTSSASSGMSASGSSSASAISNPATVSAAPSSSSAAAAAPTNAGGKLVAVAGGLLGLMLL